MPASAWSPAHPLDAGHHHAAVREVAEQEAVPSTPPLAASASSSNKSHPKPASDCAEHIRADAFLQHFDQMHVPRREVRPGIVVGR